MKYFYNVCFYFQKNVVISGNDVPQYFEEGLEDEAKIANFCMLEAFDLPILQDIEMAHWVHPKKKRGKKSIIVTLKKRSRNSNIRKCLKKSHFNIRKEKTQIYVKVKMSPEDSMLSVCARKLKKWGKISSHWEDPVSGKNVILRLNDKNPISIKNEMGLFKIISAEDKKKLIEENKEARMTNPNLCILGNKHCKHVIAQYVKEKEVPKSNNNTKKKRNHVTWP